MQDALFQSYLYGRVTAAEGQRLLEAKQREIDFGIALMKTVDGLFQHNRIFTALGFIPEDKQINVFPGLTVSEN